MKKKKCLFSRQEEEKVREESDIILKPGKSTAEIQAMNVNCSAENRRMSPFLAEVTEF